MGSSAKNYLITLLLYVSVVNEISFPGVLCQEEEADQCLPRKTFFALLRLPEVSSNLAAYSRTARIIQDAKTRNEMVNLKTSAEDNEDAEICLPVGVYLDLFSYPTMRGPLTAIGRAQKMFEDPATRAYITSEDLDRAEAAELLESEKRSIATLAKNGDLPISIQDKTDEEDEEEKRSLLTEDGRPLHRDELEALLRYSDLEKRNIASLARDYGLPSGKRNVASLARDFALPPTTSGKRNVAALARDFALPSGKRNVAALARDFALPSGKRNIAALARDYGLPSGKRYVDIFSRGSLPRYQPYGDKRNFAALVRNGDLPVGFKRNVAALARDWTLPTQNRFGRSLESLENRLREGPKEAEARKHHGEEAQDLDEKKLEALANTKLADRDGDDSKNHSEKKVTEGKRPKRQIDFSDEYPLPVMQNTNVLDYEDMIEALTDDYPNTEKRFMGRIPQMGPRPTTPPTRRLGR